VKCLGVEVAARGDPNVLREIVDEALLRKVAIRTEVDPVLNAPDEKREGLTEMSQHQLGSRKAIKDAAIDDAQRMRRRLRGETPVRAGKLRMVVIHDSVVRRARVLKFRFRAGELLECRSGPNWRRPCPSVP